jgi:hypothetical protein
MSKFPRHGRLPVRTRLHALAVVAVAALVAVSAALAATSRSAVKPTNSSPPSANGDASVGSTLTASPGTWDGSGPISFQYQWQVCGGDGKNCHDVAGETDKTYKVRSGDLGNTLRVRVIASNSDGSSSATSDATAKVAAASPAPTPTAPAQGQASGNGCPKMAAGAQSVQAASVSAPARLQLTQFDANVGVIRRSTSSFTVRFHVADTCGQAVQGAQVYATAVPYNQVSIPPVQQTDANGDVTLQFHQLRGFPAARNQQLLVMFVRATRAGDNPLAGISTRRLVSLPVDLRG